MATVKLEVWTANPQTQEPVMLEETTAEFSEDPAVIGFSRKTLETMFRAKNGSLRVFLTE